jgi:hypothetical protein
MVTQTIAATDATTTTMAGTAAAGDTIRTIITCRTGNGKDASGLVSIIPEAGTTITTIMATIVSITVHTADRAFVAAHSS